MDYEMYYTILSQESKVGHAIICFRYKVKQRGFVDSSIFE